MITVYLYLEIDSRFLVNLNMFSTLRSVSINNTILCSSIESSYTGGDSGIIMVRKISIMLALSIVTLTAVLVTGTVANIVSAANSINVQTSQHPVTGMGSPHIVRSGAHDINVQTKTNQHPITGIGNAHIVSSKSSPGTGPCIAVPGLRPINCLADIQGMHLGPVPGDDPYRWKVDGRLVGMGSPWIGSDWPIDNAAMEIKVKIGKDGHAWYTPGVVGKTDANGIFQYTFSLCDKPQYSDHSALFIAYLVGTPGQYSVVVAGNHPGPYGLPVSSSVNGVLKICQTPSQKG
jgi:hypothetical protein